MVAPSQDPRSGPTKVRNRGAALVLLVLLGALGASRCFDQPDDHGNIVNPDPRDERRGAEKLRKHLAD